MKYAVVAALTGVLFASGCSKTAEGKATPGAEAPSAEAAAGPAAGAGTPADAHADAKKKTAKPDPNATARSETDEYIVEVRQAADLSAGMDTKVQVVVIPKGTYHFNLEFPTSVSVAAPAGVSIDKAKQGLKDAVTKDETNGATWDVSMTVSDKGEKEFRADVKFAVCTDTTCDPQKTTLAWKVDVK